MTNSHNKIDADLTLVDSPPLERLVESLHDLIRISFEASTKTRSTLLRLEKFQYVSGERLDDRYCMLFAVQVKELAQNVTTQQLVSFAVSMEPSKCFPHS